MSFTPTSMTRDAADLLSGGLGLPPALPDADWQTLCKSAEARLLALLCLESGPSVADANYASWLDLLANWVKAVQAAKMLASPKIALKIDALRSELKQRHVVTIDRVLEEYAKLAFFDARKLFDDNGAVLPVSQWPDDAAAAIGGLDVAEIGLGDGDALGVVKKLKLIDKRGALDSLARHLGMFVDKQEVSVVQPPKIIVELSNE